MSNLIITRFGIYKRVGHGQTPKQPNAQTTKQPNNQTTRLNKKTLTLYKKYEKVSKIFIMNVHTRQKG